MRFFVTNDERLGTIGLQSLERAAARFGEVVTVAPAKPQSGVSHQLTLERPHLFGYEGGNDCEFQLNLAVSGIFAIQVEILMNALAVT